MKEKVEEALKALRPNLQADGGDIELVDITEDGTVRVKFQGACACCPGAHMTLKFYIEEQLKQLVPEVKEVVMA